MVRVLSLDNPGPAAWAIVIRNPKKETPHETGRGVAPVIYLLVGRPTFFFFFVRKQKQKKLSFPSFLWLFIHPYTSIVYAQGKGKK